MNVGYSKAWGVTMTVLGAIVLVLNLITGNLIGLIPGVVCLVVGAAYLARPYFRLEPGVIIVKAPLGPVERRYPYAEGEIKIENDKVWVKGKKLGLSKFMADNTQWQNAMTQLQTNTFD